MSNRFDRQIYEGQWGGGSELGQARLIYETGADEDYSEMLAVIKDTIEISESTDIRIDGNLFEITPKNKKRTVSKSLMLISPRCGRCSIINI